MADYKALVLGSTGAIGQSQRCTKIIALSRRAIDPSAFATVFPGVQPEGASKIHVQVVDYDNIVTADSASFQADAAFCCLGTTRHDAGSDEAFRKEIEIENVVDLEYVANTGKLLKPNNVPYFALVSAMNANANSWFLYPKTKGVSAEAIKALNFQRTTILEPGLSQRGDLTRFAERLGHWFFVPSVSVAAVAKSMIHDYEVNGTTSGVRIVSNSEIKAFD
ncbi:oxidoreductase htatip2 [Thraustotheca clavata]|uniref:Oxidoreductase htatip2 n=1 Tax=Thraustotheca clavata TaxID=74557 RepID=A0A1W0A371_9STRA|nr:oxidoreductase htatip2 [Thraustotheca clavata]